MDGREVEEEISKWTEEVITGCDQKGNREEKQALKKRTSRSSDLRAEAAFALIVARLNPRRELNCVVFCLMTHGCGRGGAAE